jgi:hypothetical protein
VAPRPDPVAEVKAFAALALDLARVEPRRRPGPGIQRWYRDLAGVVGAEPRDALTNRDLAMAAIVLRRHADAAPRPAPRTTRRGPGSPAPTAK